MDELRAVDVLFDIGKASKTVFNSIFINKLLNYRLYKDSEMDWNTD